MATVEKRRNKSGEVIGYRITVRKGQSFAMNIGISCFKCHILVA